MIWNYLIVRNSSHQHMLCHYIRTSLSRSVKCQILLNQPQLVEENNVFIDFDDNGTRYKYYKSTSFYSVIAVRQLNCCHQL